MLQKKDNSNKVFNFHSFEKGKKIIKLQKSLAIWDFYFILYFQDLTLSQKVGMWKTYLQVFLKYEFLIFMTLKKLN